MANKFDEVPKKGTQIQKGSMAKLEKSVMLEEDIWMPPNLFYVLEMIAFTIERAFTMYLTLDYSTKSHALSMNGEASSTARIVFGVSNMCFFLSYLFGPLLAKALPSRLTCDQLTKRKKWHDVERLAFWNERFGMLLFFIPGIINSLPSANSILPHDWYYLPSIVLFPFANILYLEWYFFFGPEKDQEHEEEIKKVRSMNEVQEKQDESEEKEAGNIDESAHGQKALEECEEKHKEDRKKWKEQEKDLLEKVASASSEIEVYKVRAMESDEKIYKLEEYNDELVTEINSCKICEKSWAEKFEKQQEKHKEEREKLKEQEKDLLDKVSGASSEIEVYKVRAMESDEKIGKLEEERNMLIIKLGAANVTCQLYRDILHNPKKPNFTFT